MAMIKKAINSIIKFITELILMVFMIAILIFKSNLHSLIFLKSIQYTNSNIIGQTTSF